MARGCFGSGDGDRDRSERAEFRSGKGDLQCWSVIAVACEPIRLAHGLPVHGASDRYPVGAPAFAPTILDAHRWSFDDFQHGRAHDCGSNFTLSPKENRKAVASLRVG